LELVGPAYRPALKRLEAALARLDPQRTFIRYTGPVPPHELHDHYAQADLCLFASSCEDMPHRLLEGMASGLPVPWSRLGPMPEVLGEGGVYFDPEQPQDIAAALRKLIESVTLREQLSRSSFTRARAYSWQRCADETFAFLASVVAASPAALR